MMTIIILLLLPISLPFLGLSFGVRKIYLFVLRYLLDYVEHVRQQDIIQEKKRKQKKTGNDTTNMNTNQIKTNQNTTTSTDTNNTLNERENENENEIITPSLKKSKSYQNLSSSSLLAADSISSTNNNNNNNNDNNNKDMEYGTLRRAPSFGTFRKNFHFLDACGFATDAMQAIIDDDVTRCFSKQNLDTWNMLTRSKPVENDTVPLSFRLQIIYFLGIFARYVVFFPFRFIFALIAVVFFVCSFSVIACLPPSRLRKTIETQCSFFTARMFVLSWSAMIRYHNTENRAKNGIVVANHTSPIDCIVLANDNCYSMVGQRHGGFIGLLQKVLSIAQTHIWFDRSETKDRQIVAKRLREHVENKDNNPVLIFPEGTCVNNTSVMMFKKGSFEVGATIYPVAIKYHASFGECFWDSSKQNFLMHIFSLMTTWAVVTDVYYLPPTTQQPGEDSIEFAKRVKFLIAQKVGLNDLQWDGMLKRKRVGPELKDEVQKEYSELLTMGL